MAFKYEDLIIDQSQQLQAERAEAMAELEAGRQTEDIVRCREAEKRILQIDNDHERLERYANQFVMRQQAQQPANQFGLSQAEIEVAHNSFGPIKRNGHYVDLSKDEKERLYAEQRNKYHYMRQTGQYRDDQGTIRR
jgi:hypothetical protein